MNKWLKLNMTLAISFLFVFQGCSDNDGDSGTGPESPDAPSTYTFESRFEDGVSSVSYSGQVVRNLLIRDIKGEAAVDAGITTAEALNVYFENSDTEAMISTSSSYTAEQEKYHDVSTKNLSGKISDAVVKGYDQTPTSLMQDWFMKVEEGGKETAEGLRLDQMIAKGLLGAVSYYQATSVYLATIDDDDNTVSDDGEPYTEMEHHWDESFGYFGASRDYGTLVDDNARKSSFDSDANGTINYLTEYNFDWAVYAAKRDICVGCDSGEFTEAIFNAYVEGRHLIATQASLTSIQEQRTIIVNNWEKVIAANIVHYANSVVADIESGSSDINKHWSEMRAFAMALQFNSFKLITDSDLNSIVELMGNNPPTADDFAIYSDNLNSIKTTLQNTYMFTDNDLVNW